MVYITLIVEKDTNVANAIGKDLVMEHLSKRINYWNKKQLKKYWDKIDPRDKYGGNCGKCKGTHTLIEIWSVANDEYLYLCEKCFTGSKSIYKEKYYLPHHVAVTTTSCCKCKIRVKEHQPIYHSKKPSGILCERCFKRLEHTGRIR